MAEEHNRTGLRVDDSGLPNSKSTYDIQPTIFLDWVLAIDSLDSSHKFIPLFSLSCLHLAGVPRSGHIKTLPPNIHSLELTWKWMAWQHWKTIFLHDQFEGSRPRSDPSMADSFCEAIAPARG